MHGVYSGRALLSSVNGFSNMPDSMLYSAVSFLKRGIIGTLWSTLEPGSTLNMPPLLGVPHVHRAPSLSFVPSTYRAACLRGVPQPFFRMRPIERIRSVAALEAAIQRILPFLGRHAGPSTSKNPWLPLAHRHPGPQKHTSPKGVIMGDSPNSKTSPGRYNFTDKRAVLAHVYITAMAC